MGNSELQIMDRAKDYTLSFEAVKTSFRQTKDGYHLTLVLHPNDVPQDLFSSWVGTRYQCAMVQLSDDDQPMKTKESIESDANIQQAGMLCRSPRFQTWIHQRALTDIEERDVWGESEEDHTVRVLTKLCGISSRKELATDLEGRKIFKELCDAYIEEVENASG